jgi:hypothetical protein
MRTAEQRQQVLPRRIAINQLALISRALGSSLDQLVEPVTDGDVAIRPTRDRHHGATRWRLTREHEPQGSRREDADLSRGTWLNEDLGRQPFGNYARDWLRDHPKMGPRYRETCTRPVAFDDDPKTDAGKRTVAIPPHVGIQSLLAQLPGTVEV